MQALIVIQLSSLPCLYCTTYFEIWWFVWCSKLEQTHSHRGAPSASFVTTFRKADIKGFVKLLACTRTHAHTKRETKKRGERKAAQIKTYPLYRAVGIGTEAAQTGVFRCTSIISFLCAQFERKTAPLISALGESTRITPSPIGSSLRQMQVSAFHAYICPRSGRN